MSRGPHVSAAFWVQVPENSGDFVFRYKPNPYIVANNHKIKRWWFFDCLIALWNTL